MSRLDDLADQYETHIRSPWQRNLAGAQRVTFVVYAKDDERRLQIKLKDFENRTKDAGHHWVSVDLTNVFAEWLGHEEYRNEYFLHPEDLSLKLPTEFAEHCANRIRAGLQTGTDPEKTVVAVHGIAALFGLVHLSPVLHQIEGDIRGRLVLFFPGSYEQNNYRFMDARDGWNYLATPIVSLL